MWKLILIAIVALAIWAFINPKEFNGKMDEIKTNMSTTFSQEKTIQKVTGSRAESAKEAQDIINNQ